MSDMGDSRAAPPTSGMGQSPCEGRPGNNGNVVAQDGETININDDPPQYDHPPPPPPYDDAEASYRLCGRIQATLNTERGGEDTDPAETESLRKFLLYCLSVDYRFIIESQELPACTRDKYIEMINLMTSLRYSRVTTDLRESERTLLALYLWKYLHRPCKRLCIPIELAVRVIYRFTKHMNISNRYKGCVHGLLQSNRLEELAHKFWQDRNILIPRLADNEHTRRGLTECLTELARQYFVSIDGVHSTIVVVPGEEWGDGWEETVGISYKPAARGASYDLARERTLMANVLDYARIFQDRIAWCLDNIRYRRDVFPAGEIDSDWYASWIGPSEDYEMDVGMQSTFGRWVWYPSLHIPDMFEHRPAIDRCEQ
jgi:hypothetical protein